MGAKCFIIRLINELSSDDKNIDEPIIQQVSTTCRQERRAKNVQ